MAIKDLAEGRSDVFKLPIGKVSIKEGDNIRKDYGDIDAFAQRIAKRGLKNIFTVRISEDGEKAYIVDGHRRFMALTLSIEKYGATITHIRCQNEIVGTNEESRVLDMLAFNDYKPLDPIEEGEAYHRLIGFGWDAKKIALETGNTATYIKQRLELNSAPHDLRQAVKEEKISPSTALEITRAPEEKQEAVRERLKTSPKGERVKITEIQYITKKIPNVLSTKKARVALEEATDFSNKIPADKVADKAFWTGIVRGIEIALGVRQLNVTEVFQES